METQIGRQIGSLIGGALKKESEDTPTPEPETNYLTTEAGDVLTAENGDRLLY